MKKNNMIKTGVFAGMLLLPGTMKGESLRPVLPDLTETLGADTQTVKYLRVWNISGGYISFPLEVRPRIIGDTEKGIIKCIAGTEEISFPMNDIHKYTLEECEKDEPTLVDEINREEGRFRMSPASILFEEFRAGSKVQVYTTNGVLADTYVIASDGRLSISTQSWQPGIYLIKTETTTFKIIKK